MIKKTLSLFTIIFTLTLFVFSNPASAVTLKIGVLVPEGTTWAKNLKKMAKEIKKATNKKVKIKIYFGGAQGDEPDVLRKIRIGQLGGGVFTGKTLGDINGDVRVMEVPFIFMNDRSKALKTLNSMAPYFNKSFEKNEFTNLGFFELGMVYFVSQKKTPSIDSMKGIKIWAWEGDQLVSSMISAMNLVSVPLPLPDVLSSLSTGIVEAAYAPPLGIIALQWNTKIKYLVDFPLAYATGAILISKKKWAKISVENQKIVKAISAKYIKHINAGNIKDNEDALEAIKGLGVEFVKFQDTDIARAKKYRDSIVKKLKGKLFSADAWKILKSKL
ncbi:MAG: TRAP transporter substrate-binding protein DctP [Bacteriovoracaceae bacterium]|jgi:TRAP-type transport system periplasmic protein|nr:TRAP transporter substrate-binding protein DctP [Bacteriovoracaceae bacterium]